MAPESGNNGPVDSASAVHLSEVAETLQFTSAAPIFGL
jgi:hypothetical protein